jgi:hypothetical protein
MLVPYCYHENYVDVSIFLYSKLGPDIWYPGLNPNLFFNFKFDMRNILELWSTTWIHIGNPAILNIEVLDTSIVQTCCVNHLI